MEENKNESQIINNEENKKKPRSFKLLIISIIILSIILSSFFGSIFGVMGSVFSSKIVSKIETKLGKRISQQNQKQIDKEHLVEEDSAVIDVVDKSSPAVISIVISKDVPKYRSFFADPFGFFSDPGNQESGTEKQTIGKGSGFFVSQDGMIATNKHVVSDATAEYTVITSDGKEYPAKVLALDPVKDIAVIKVTGENFPTLSFGDSSLLKIGQTVIAIGNSLGEFYNTVSKGIVSGLRRNLTAGSGSGGQTEQLSDIIQTDAAINPGNSGGPLLDISGNVIGINVAMAQGAQNIGFAIPADQIKKVVDQVKNNGKISTPFLGVRSVTIDEQIQKENNLPYSYGAIVTKGSKVSDLAVLPGSPADKAGIQENDIILEVDGTKVDSKKQLTSLVSSYNVGDTVTLKIWRKGSTIDVKVTLEERK